MTSIAYALRDICHARNCIPPLWVACKVLLSGIQILADYARCQCFLLHGTYASCCKCGRLHATRPKYIFMKPQKLLQAHYASTAFELSKDSRVFMKLTTDRVVLK